jgi:nucleoside-triphosphatase
MAKVLVEGRPGVGKTTVARRCVQLLIEAGIPVVGFTTAEMRIGGRRVGFAIDVIDGASALLAHVDFPGPPRVGRYGVDLAAFERLALPPLALEHDAVHVIDELGKMELASTRFQTLVDEVFVAVPRVLATVHRHRHPFTDRLKARADVVLVQVTPLNRQSLAPELVAAVLR